MRMARIICIYITPAAGSGGRPAWPLALSSAPSPLALDTTVEHQDFNMD